MISDLIKYAKVLNEHDNKNLSQKLTKTMEEVGELAREVLPYEDASGTIHRFATRRKILEEAVDVLLCAQSILHEVATDDEEIESMMRDKLNKWAYIQDAENRVAGKPIPFEIHVTVSLHDSMIDTFRQLCGKMGVKPIVLDLQVADDTLQDVMTSSTHFGTNSSAQLEMVRIEEELRYNGFIVLRSKIETVPWHPAAPQSETDVMPPGCYFESHLAVVCTDDTKEELRAIADRHKAHLSRNRFKQLEDGKFINMVTYRRSDACTYKMFQNDLVFLKRWIEKAGFEVEKEIVEFALFDSNQGHDYSWIKKVEQYSQMSVEHDSDIDYNELNN